MKAIRPQLKEFHYGRQLFNVSVHIDWCDRKFKAEISEAKCLSRPYDGRIFKNKVSLFIKVEKENLFLGGTYTARNSLSDRAVVWHGGYNLHRMFTKRKQAEKYAKRINAGCLSATERKHLAESVATGRCF